MKKMTGKRLSLKKKLFSRRLLKWFYENGRDFAWRHTRNPYKIMVSEMLLQRTRADNVLPVYKEFLTKYPNVKQLANSKEIDIKKTIESLGLQKPRAERLKKLAIHVVKDYDGKIPLDEDKLLSLPGIGYYMAHAILCFTETEEKAVIDWNVVRVFKRVWGYKMKSSPHTDKKLMAFNQNILPKGKGRIYNWALLDFAALICKPRKPLCDICPIFTICMDFGSDTKK